MQLVPLVDFNRCEAKADCVAVCPCDVFEIRTIEPEHKAALSLRGRVKTFFHGSKKAYTPNAIACHACKLCVQACPEIAIQLVPR
jgi:NAD-dependent dihydropyrimidine dehydrogenase PreA subunit